MHQFFIFFQDDTAILSTRIRKPDIPVVSDESGAGEVVQFRVCKYLPHSDWNRQGSDCR